MKEKKPRKRRERKKLEVEIIFHEDLQITREKLVKDLAEFFYKVYYE